MANPYRNVLIYVFAVFQEVSLLINDCGNYSCIYGFCCFDSCCFKKPEMAEFDNSLFFILSMAFMAFVFLSVMCLGCRKICKGHGESQPEGPSRDQPTPPPPAVLPGFIAPPPSLPSNPPPYSEVVGKPYFYPAPVGQPPCYDNIAMEDLSPLESPQPPR